MHGHLIGYARVAAHADDAARQHDHLRDSGVEDRWIFMDQGFIGASIGCRGLREAIAACRAGSTLVVPALERLGRSSSDLQAVAVKLSAGGISLRAGDVVFDPSDRIGVAMLSTLAMFADFDSGLARLCAQEQASASRSAASVANHRSKLSPADEALVVEAWTTGTSTVTQISERFGIARSTVYRAIERWRARQAAAREADRAAS
ncbi:DNA resolvase [Clavibacter michiganensis]|uniref:recombinase family protein n=1 Tax=Clavibacter michiganensis TaxID=28447 RepID=UPI000CE75AD3|nr:recombinase family protein [Clavibacter michiganensis]PPF91299.1 DNA resolvase [Clavibacter michiganensis]PPF99341.1 DNA resolvase [Clavibacter michiganensis]